MTPQPKPNTLCSGDVDGYNRLSKCEVVPVDDEVCALIDVPLGSIHECVHCGEWYHPA
ncbi:uncharacterized protein EHS24_005623 [Apiotrichum porosum]|uniref:Uncharacterized protein n=1 Tax=Apiotrichum porosum TaxID=105984 RepID=A0A427XZ68_9TREE|nr:uncharacterized protein EHS24_005623 [Apiotrichum porosum]RSH84121.1 hypothetical protein EHS24_005623 [Apiotrichum porosum]